METIIYFLLSNIYRYSSYPTYEEWKPVISMLKSSILCCSYPTYEEWKHNSRELKVYYLIVLILPMRNGNVGNIGEKSNRGALVLILPMRNGN